MQLLWIFSFYLFLTLFFYLIWVKNIEKLGLQAYQVGLVLNLF